MLACPAKHVLFFPNSRSANEPSRGPIYPLNRPDGIGQDVKEILVPGGDLTAILERARPACEREAAAAREKSAKELIARGGVSYDNYQRLNDGMSYFDATIVLGGEGRELNRLHALGVETVTYRWSNWRGQKVEAVFTADRLVAKSQSGLR
jgi:hypothetical protein